MYKHITEWLGAHLEDLTASSGHKTGHGQSYQYVGDEGSPDSHLHASGEANIPITCSDVIELSSSGLFKETGEDNIASSVQCDKTDARMGGNARHRFSKVSIRQTDRQTKHSGRCLELAYMVHTEWFLNP